jgi:hypothetical protein
LQVFDEVEAFKEVDKPRRRGGKSYERNNGETEDRDE